MGLFFNLSSVSIFASIWIFREHLDSIWESAQEYEFILQQNLLCGANSALARQEYAVLQRDERVPRRAETLSAEPKAVCPEGEPEKKLPISKSKVTEIKFGALEVEEWYAGFFLHSFLV